MQKELSNIKDPALRQWVSYAIGSAASAVAEGTTQTGGSIAASGTKNNYLSDWQKEEKKRQLANCNTDEERQSIEKYWDSVDTVQDAIMSAKGYTPYDLKNYDNLMQEVSTRAQEILSNPNALPGDYDGFKITSTGGVFVLVGAAWVALNVNWQTLTLGSPALAQVDPNKLNHIFGKPQHNLAPFLSQYGGNQVSAYNALQNAAQQQIVAKGISGVFEEVISVNNTLITVRGNVVDGIVKIGTAFIP